MGRQLTCVTVFCVVFLVKHNYRLLINDFEQFCWKRWALEEVQNGIWLRNGMLIFQFTVATFFIVGSYIVYQQIDYLTNNLGFKEIK
jgi:putative ABC transport system permease protein